MQMLEEIKNCRKEWVYDNYVRIIEDAKDYEKITKVKMIDEVYKLYKDYHNIIDICTVRELKYLEMILNNSRPNDVYEWELKTLVNKFLIFFDIHGKYSIPEEIKDSVKVALKNVDYKKHQKIDKLNEILVGYCKIQGTALLNVVAEIGVQLTNLSREYVYDHVLDNKLFNYYVYTILQDFDTIGEDIPVAVYFDYYDYIEDIDEQRKNQGLAGSRPIDIQEFKTIFYNDFNINNTKVKKLLDEIEVLPIFKDFVLETIRKYALLNLDRDDLKEAIQNIPILHNYDLTDFFKVLDEAMDEMPSGVLNGFTPNEAKKIKIEELKINKEKEEKYQKQVNACLSKEDADLFYKLYFGLLEYTNKIYKIKPNLKIYKCKRIDPHDLIDIVRKFWLNKDKLIDDFCKENPFKFNNEELDSIKEFKKGKRSFYIICEYQKEYTGIIDDEKVYMIKGITCNIDEVISYKDLPCPVETTLLPFKGVLIYDSILSSMSISFGSGMIKGLMEDYNKKIKYYHL